MVDRGSSGGITLKVRTQMPSIQRANKKMTRLLKRTRTISPGGSSGMKEKNGSSSKNPCRYSPLFSIIPQSVSSAKARSVYQESEPDAPLLMKRIGKTIKVNTISKPKAVPAGSDKAEAPVPPLAAPSSPPPKNKRNMMVCTVYTIHNHGHNIKLN